MSEPVCLACGNREGNASVAAREMMLGLRDRFTYLACAACGSLQLLDAPADWARYYPEGYYSFSSAAARPEGGLKRRLKRCRARHALGRRTPLGALLTAARGSPPFGSWLAPAGLGWDDPILDVGSGAGALLRELSAAGFTDLTGSDPFVAGDLDLGGGARVLKRHLRELAGPYALVMMHHSFEHVEDPAATLAEAARLLAPGRTLLIRLPVAGTYAWREYGADWVQLDAPRHRFLPSERGLRLLAERGDFTVREVRYDSTRFQFWGSEQYRRDIPLHDDRSFGRNPAGGLFTREQIAEFDRRAAELNERGDGDQACFRLVRR